MSTKRTTASATKSKRFTAEERAAMKERAQELKAAKNKAMTTAGSGRALALISGLARSSTRQRQESVAG